MQQKGMSPSAVSVPGARNVWFLYGLSGTGKSWVADRLGAYFGWPVYHADDDITPAMKQALAESRPFTPVMRDAYFEQLAVLIQQRLALAGDNQDIVISQGAYKKRHRQFLAERISNFRPVWIDAPQSLWVERIQQRNEGISLRSAKALQADFEPPEEDSMRLVNDGDFAHVLAQFQRLRKLGAGEQ